MYALRGLSLVMEIFDGVLDARLSRTFKKRHQEGNNWGESSREGTSLKGYVLIVKNNLCSLKPSNVEPKVYMETHGFFLQVLYF